MVGGTGVFVGGSGVLVGSSGVAVGGSGVTVGGSGVLVGGNGVSVGGNVVLVGATVGEATVAVGVGVGLGSAAIAESTWIRAMPVTLPPLRESLMDAPVLVSAVNMALTDAPGSFDFNTAQAPVTCGAAMEVPLLNEYASPGTDEYIEDPGARSEMKEAIFEKEETVFDEVVDPTLIAVEMQAGAPMALVYPLFPDEMTVAIPTERS